jgi:hypothetical protein
LDKTEQLRIKQHKEKGKKMEILIAILWYLQVIFIGGSYSQAQVNQMIQGNIQSINQVQQNQQLTNQIVNDFNQQADLNFGEKGAIDVWEDDKPEPIPN